MVKRARYTVWIAVAAAVLVALAIAFSVPWRLNFARDWIEARALASTGRALKLEGDVWWRWGRIGTLSADRLRFANPSWAGRPDMVNAERVELGVAVLPLLKGRLELHQVRALRPDVWLEHSGARRNWYLDPQQSDGQSAIVFHGPLRIDDGRIVFAETEARTLVEARLQTQAIDGKQRLAASATGQYRGLALKAEAKGDDLLLLRAARDRDALPYRFELDATLGATVLSARGELRSPTDLQEADVRLNLRGASLGEWYRIAGIGLPDTPPYRTSGRVRHDGKTWFYEDFTSTVGRSDLGGRLVFEPGARREAGRPLITGKLVSRSLDMRDLGPTIGTAGDAGNPRNAAGKKPAEPAGADDGDGVRRADGAAPAAQAASSAGRRVLPQGRFDARRWDTLDADIEFNGASVRNLGRFPLEDLVMRVKLQDRRIDVAPISVQAGGGKLKGSLRIDGNADPMRAQIDADWRGLQLQAVLPQTENSRAALGRLNGRVKLSGQGNSFAQLLGSATGEAQLAMGRGRMSNLLIELMDLDAFEALSFFARGDRDVEVRCAVIDGVFERGRMTPRTAVFDTNDTIVTATGTVDFARERLDLRVTPLPKDKSPLTLRVPFDVKGSFAQPDISPDKGQLAARGGGALLLGLINPLAALIPLFESGPGEDADCTGLTALARKEGVPVGPAAKTGERPSNAPVAAPGKPDQNK